MKNYREAECCGTCKYRLESERRIYVCNLRNNYFKENLDGYFEFRSVYNMNVCDNYIPKNIIINKS